MPSRRPLDLQRARRGGRAGPEAWLTEAQVEVLKDRDEELILEISGADDSFVNSLRRTLLQDVPSMAFEVVEVHANTSIIEDEVLCQRLGLVPIKVDPKLFRYREEGSSEVMPDDTIVFQLRVRCELDPESGLARHSTVFARDLVLDEGSHPAAIAHPDIPLVELAPGQEVACACHAHKGTGKKNAKFSPVASAHYRRAPLIEVRRAVPGDLAEQLVARCPVGVFDIEDAGIVINSRACTGCLECTKWSKDGKTNWADYVRLAAYTDRFEFTIESVARPARELYEEAMEMLIRGFPAEAELPAEELPDEGELELVEVGTSTRPDGGRSEGSPFVEK